VGFALLWSHTAPVVLVLGSASALVASGLSAACVVPGRSLHVLCILLFIALICPVALLLAVGANVIGFVALAPWR
jgi:hypothetical protein